MFSGELGYHTFLYPTVKEIRNLFIVLIGNIKPFNWTINCHHTVGDSYVSTHCNEKPIYVFLFWELRGLSPNSTFMCLRSIYIFPGSVHIFSSSRKGRSIVGIYNCSQTHEYGEYGNWDCGRAVPFLGIFVSNFRYCFFAVHVVWSFKTAV